MLEPELVGVSGNRGHRFGRLITYGDRLQMEQRAGIDADDNQRRLAFHIDLRVRLGLVVRLGGEHVLDAREVVIDALAQGRVGGRQLSLCVISIELRSIRSRRTCGRSPSMRTS